MSWLPVSKCEKVDRRITVTPGSPWKFDTKYCFVDEEFIQKNNEKFPILKFRLSQIHDSRNKWIYISAKDLLLGDQTYEMFPHPQKIFS